MFTLLPCFRLSEVRENEISLRKWSGGSAQLRALQGTLLVRNMLSGFNKCSHNAFLRKECPQVEAFHCFNLNQKVERSIPDHRSAPWAKFLACQVKSKFQASTAGRSSSLKWCKNSREHYLLWGSHCNMNCLSSCTSKRVASGILLCPQFAWCWWYEWESWSMEILLLWRWRLPDTLLRFRVKPKFVHSENFI